MSSSRKKKPPATVLFAENLTATPRAVSTAEIVKKMGMVAWTDVPLFKSKHRFIPEKINPDEVLTEAQYSALQKQSLLMSSKIKICYTGETGYAAIANEDLPAKFKILYAGTLESYARENLTQEIRYNCYQTSVSDNLIDQPGAIVHLMNARERGNITRFIQHAEQESDLQEHYTLNSPLTVTQVACANMIFQRNLVGNLPISYVLSIMPIKKNELLVVDYGLDYWSVLNLVPKLFYKDGSLINPSSYRFHVSITIILSHDLGDKVIDFSSKVDKEFIQNCQEDMFKITAECNGRHYLAEVPIAKIQQQLILNPRSRSIQLTPTAVISKPIAATNVIAGLQRLNLHAVTNREQKEFQQDSQASTVTTAFKL